MSLTLQNMSDNFLDLKEGYETEIFSNKPTSGLLSPKMHYFAPKKHLFFVWEILSPVAQIHNGGWNPQFLVTWWFAVVGASFHPSKVQASPVGKNITFQAQLAPWVCVK